MASWQDKTSKIQVGDRVAYKASFLRSTGQYTGDIPHARGIVTDIKPFGDNALATIDWKNDEIPPKVLLSNLSKVTERGIAAE